MISHEKQGHRPTLRKLTLLILTDNNGHAIFRWKSVLFFPLRQTNVADTSTIP